MRRLTAAAVAALALAGVAGCRTAPDVAAYVGDERVTVAELEAAVDERLSDEAVAQAAGDDRSTYVRRVLATLVEGAVHDEAAERYGVEVTEQQVRERIDVLLGGQDPEEAYAQLAEQGFSRQDVFASVRQQLIRLGIAEEEGLAEALSDEALRERYEQARSETTEIELGYITVPDQRTAQQVVAALEADPDRYTEFAQRFAGPYTLAEVATRSPQEIPGPLAEQALAARPGTAFAVPVEETGGVVVGFVGEFPTFEELRPELENQAGGEVEEAVRPVMEEVRGDLDVVVNPRYGELSEGQIVPLESGVVDILSAEG